MNTDVSIDSNIDLFIDILYHLSKLDLIMFNCRSMTYFYHIYVSVKLVRKMTCISVIMMF